MVGVQLAPFSGCLIDQAVNCLVHFYKRCVSIVGYLPTPVFLLNFFLGQWRPLKLATLNCQGIFCFLAVSWKVLSTPITAVWVIVEMNKTKANHLECRGCGWNGCRYQQTRSDMSVRKLPEGNCQRNRLSLNWCSPYTEIFSKRRKIYTVCVESLSREWICFGNSIMTWKLSGPLVLMKLFNLLWCIQRS